MHDQISAEQARSSSEPVGLPEQANVLLEEVQAFSLIQFAAWPETITPLGANLAGIAGVAAAPAPGRSETGKTASILRVEPLKWWLISELSEAEMPVIEAAEGCVLDMSHSRCWIRVSGDKATVLLNHFLPIDMRDTSFPQGSVVSTAFHHVGVTLWRDGETYNLLLPRSFAGSLWELLCDSAKQYGLGVK